MHSSCDNRHRWAVILAGGDGVRLQGLTHLITGAPCPKQFCSFFGGRSLLDQTRERIAPLFEREQTFFALTRAHEPYYRSELQDVPDRRKIAQPANRGTAIAMAICLQRIIREDEDALVGFFPSDHHYLDADAFQNSVELGFQAAEADPHFGLMLGAKPTYPEVEYGWIEPGRTLVDAPGHALRRVSRFWEKPRLRQARTLLGRECLWNTFVTIARATAFLEILQTTVPELMQLAERGWSNGLDAVYSAITPLDFSRAVLSSAPHRLLVLEDAMSGWTDLGSPVRLLKVAGGNGAQPAWLRSAAALEVGFRQRRAGFANSA